MSNLTSGAPKKPSAREMWAHYAAPPIAATGAMMPAFWFFKAKSAQQVGKPIPRNFGAVLLEGVRASPSLGFVVGLQIIGQQAVEKALTKDSEKKKDDFGKMALSTLFIAIISTPGLAAFNGQSLGKGAIESIKGLSMKQTAALVTRESSFLFSVRVSEPVSEEMKKRCGDNQAVAYASAFSSGVIGSTVGHPADTIFTRLQEGLNVKNLGMKQLMKGTAAKAAGVGFFCVGFKFLRENIS